MFTRSKGRIFRKFLSYYKPYKSQFFFVLLCALITTLVSLAIPLCIRYITKTILVDENPNIRDEILFMGSFMILLIFIKLFCGWFFDRTGHIIGAKIERDLRNELFSHLVHLPQPFFDGEKTGALMSRITNDLLNLAEFYHHGPENFMLYFMSVLGSLIILFQIHTGLAIVAAIFVPLMLLYTAMFFGKLQRAYRESYQKIGEMNATLEDSLSGIRVIKAFNGEKLEQQRFCKANRGYFNSRKTIYSTEALFYSGMEHLLAPLVTVAVLVAGAIWISGASLDIADLLAFLMYVGYLTAPMQQLAFMVQQYQDAKAGFERFLSLMDMEPEPHGGGRTAENIKGAIQFSNIDFSYGEQYPFILKNFSLSISPGQTVALVGSSGVGKTTLCSLITRFYRPDSGEIRIDGIPLEEMSLSFLRQNIGVVQQDMYLFAGTVMDNMLYARPDASRDEVVHAARLAHAHDFIMALPEGYETNIGQRGLRLSGGQKQRLCIARTFLKNPPILIFDEATSALDYETERYVQESLEALSTHKTTLIIAHRLSTIRNADQIIVLTDQGIAEVGTHDELMQREGIYSSLYH